MRRNVLAGIFVAVLVVAAGLFFWARTVLTGDAVRTALASQLSQALGQPVSVGGLGFNFFPRIAVSLRDVAIGDPARIQARELDLSTGLRGLVSRRIENATVSLNGARIELPLAPFALGAAAASEPDPASAAPLEIASVDEILLRDVEIVSGGRTLRGDVTATLRGDALTLEDVRLTADETTIEAKGEITNLTGPVGELQLRAGTLRLDDLMAFAAEFSGGLGTPAASPGGSPGTKAGDSGMNLLISVESERARFGTLALDQVTGRARVTGSGITIDPIAFSVFGGRYEGILALGHGHETPTFRWVAELKGIDVGAAMKFAAGEDTITGRLSGRIDLTGRGADAAAAIRTARGTARLDLVDGVVRGLGLVRTIVVATSGRSGASGLQASAGSGDEPFTRLGTTLAIANGAAKTDDLRFESADLTLTAAGDVRLDGSAVNLAGRVQLSDELSKQAGRDLVRYTQEEGRVTLPATVTGSLEAPAVRIDVAEATKRAIQNRATEEGQKLLKGLGGFGR